MRRFRLFALGIGMLAASTACGTNANTGGGNSSAAPTQTAAGGLQATTRDQKNTAAGQPAGQPPAGQPAAPRAGQAAGPPGQLDPSFGSGGVVTLDFGDSSEATAVLLQPDGKLVAGGLTTPTGKATQWALARYDQNGSLDGTFGTFGTAGKVVTAFTVEGHDVSGNVAGLALQPDGKFVAAGPVDGKFGLVRYDKTGRIDPSFGTAGRVITPYGQLTVPYGVALQPDGKILVAGTNSTNIGNGHYSFDSLLMRYNPDGSLDQGFGDHGKVVDQSVNVLTGGANPRAQTVIQNAESFFATGLGLLPDKRIVTAGALHGSDTYLLAVRYNADGS